MDQDPSVLPVRSLMLLKLLTQVRTVPGSSTWTSQYGLARPLWALLSHGYRNKIEGSCRTVQLILQVFPTTDARHPVMTPAALIVGAAVSRIAAEENPLPVNILRGLFLSQMAIHMTAQSSRFAPEALSFCCNALSCLSTNQVQLGRNIYVPIYACS